MASHYEFVVAVCINLLVVVSFDATVPNENKRSIRINLEPREYEDILVVHVTLILALTPVISPSVRKGWLS